MKHFLAILLAALVVGACSDESRAPDAGPTPNEQTIPFRDDGDLTFLRSGEDVVTIDIEIADSDSTRQRGLMQRASLPDKSGMLFIFDRDKVQSFWMSNTPLALDLLFVDRDSQIVDIEKYTQPFNASSITSDVPAQYVIEVPAGFADTYGLTEGERVRWVRADE